MAAGNALENGKDGPKPNVTPTSHFPSSMPPLPYSELWGLHPASEGEDRQNFEMEDSDMKLLE